MKTISLMAARFPFWNSTSVTNNFFIRFSLIATWLCKEGMRPCGLLANYFTSCPTQLVVNVCLKVKSIVCLGYSSKNSWVFQWVYITSVTLFVVFPACHDDDCIESEFASWAVNSCSTLWFFPSTYIYIDFFCNPPNLSGESGFHVNLDKSNIC